jgi:hypothetical protein
MITAVNMSKNELIMVPVIPDQTLNTVTTLTSAMQSSVNVNRAFMRLRGRQPIMGHAWVQANPDTFVSVHHTADGLLAYQVHSFSGKYAGHCDEATLLTGDQVDTNPVHFWEHPRIRYGDLFQDLSVMKRNYQEVSEEQREALAGWHVPVRSDKYIPRLLARVMASGRVEPVAECDPSLLSSAARLLHRQWDII